MDKNEEKTISSDIEKLTANKQSYHMEFLGRRVNFLCYLIEQNQINKSINRRNPNCLQTIKKGDKWFQNYWSENKIFNLCCNCKREPLKEERKNTVGIFIKNSGLKVEGWLPIWRVRTIPKFSTLSLCSENPNSVVVASHRKKAAIHEIKPLQTRKNCKKILHKHKKKEICTKRGFLLVVITQN